MTSELVIRPGEGWNEVRDAGMAYLAAAEAMYLAQSERAGFFAVHEWYVVHHLSVIAAELLTKACKVTYRNVEWSEDGPENYDVVHAYGGHKFQPSEIGEDVLSALRSHLTGPQYQLLVSIKDWDPASDEVARGRYPYEVSKRTGKTFPSGAEGRLAAGKWLDLARALSAFGE